MLRVTLTISDQVEKSGIAISDLDSEGEVYTDMHWSAKKSSEFHLNLILSSHLGMQHSGIAGGFEILLWNPLDFDSIQLTFFAAFQVYLPKVCSLRDLKNTTSR